MTIWGNPLWLADGGGKAPYRITDESAWYVAQLKIHMAAALQPYSGVALKDRGEAGCGGLCL